MSYEKYETMLQPFTPYHIYQVSTLMNYFDGMIVSDEDLADSFAHYFEHKVRCVVEETIVDFGFEF